MNQTPKQVSSVLRYPGGKTRAVPLLAEFLPQDTAEICSPFLGGGSFELYCASVRGLKVHAYDLFTPLVEFWQYLLEHPGALANRVESYLPVLAREDFYWLQKNQETLGSKLQRAAAFYVLNRSSFSGCTMSGGMSPGHGRFTPSAVERIRDFPNRDISTLFSVKQGDFHHSLSRHPKAMVYADPPYLLESPTLYGKKGDCHASFDHKGLRDILLQRGGRWLLSYNECQEVRDLYNGYVRRAPRWKYGMSHNKDSREVLVLSPELSDALDAERLIAA